MSQYSKFVTNDSGGGGGGSGVTTIGTIDSQTESADGATIVTTSLYMQSASATAPGLVNNTTQSLSGNKTFTGSISASNLSGTNTGNVTLTAVGAAPSANGATLSGQALTLQPADATHPGLVTTGTQTFAGSKTFSSTIAADISGNAATATTATTAATATTATNATNVATTAVSTNASFFPLFVASSSNGNQACDLDADLTYNPSTNSLTATTFVGALSGNATTATSATSATTATTATTATNATNIATTSVSTNASFFPIFVASSSNGNQAPDLATGLTFNPSTNTLTTTTFVGALTGNATNVSGVVAIANGGTGQSTKAAGFDALSPMTTGGDIIYGGASGTGTRLANGSAGQVLTSAGSTSAPTWTTIASSNLAVATKTANYTLTTNDNEILADATGGTFTLTLPTAVGNTGKVFYMKKIDSSANVVTVATTSSQTIDGSTTRNLATQNESWTVVSDGANWVANDHFASTPWVSYSVSITAAGSNPTKGTVAADNGVWRRIGDSVEIRWQYRQTAAGAAGNGNYRISLPTGVAVDTAKFNIDSQLQDNIIGTAQVDNLSNPLWGYCIIDQSTTLGIYIGNSANDATRWGSGFIPFSSTNVLVAMIGTFPVSGWDA